MMSNALDALRAQRDAVEQVHARLGEVATLVRALRTEIEAIGQDRAFREVLRDETTWLDQAERTTAEVRRLREQELSRFWPGVWRRSAAAFVLSLATLASCGAGYALASRPFDAELVSLRQRVELLDVIG
jgi:hypothetical protein